MLTYTLTITLTCNIYMLTYFNIYMLIPVNINMCVLILTIIKLINNINIMVSKGTWKLYRLYIYWLLQRKGYFLFTVVPFNPGPCLIRYDEGFQVCSHSSLSCSDNGFKGYHWESTM